MDSGSLATTPPVATSNGEPPVRIGVATAAAVGAVLVGLGLARFAFAPLQPALVADGWFSGSGAALLAAANLAGYLIGALTGSHVARRISPPNVIRAAMLVVAASFLLCADESLPFIWFFLWRVASGIGGGMIMGLAGPTVLTYVPEARRALIGQMVLYGLTGGIIIAGALMPLLVKTSAEPAWIALGAISLLTAAATWRMWPPAQPRPHATAHESEHARLYCFQYALIAVGVVPQMIFLVDYIARDLERGVAIGSRFFLLYGLGAIIGPMLYSFLAGRIGLRSTVKTAVGVQFFSILLLIADDSGGFLTAAAFLGGLGMPALLALSLLRSQQITEGDPIRHRALWGTATASFAVGQATAAFGTVFLIDEFGERGLAYPLLFAVAAGALTIAFLMDFAIRR